MPELYALLPVDIYYTCFGNKLYKNS